MWKLIGILLACSCFLLATSTTRAADLRAVEIADGIFMIPADGAVPTVDNHARTANIMFVIGDEGVLVWNSGATYRQGQELAIRILEQVERPIRVLALNHVFQDVIFGWRAFHEIGAEVWMHGAGYELMQQRCQTCLKNLDELLGKIAMFGTTLVEPSRQLTCSTDVASVGRKIEILDLGHSGGPNNLVLFDHPTGTLLSGNLVFTDRLLEVRDGDHAGWVAALDKLAAMPVQHVVPDYGAAAGPEAIARTRDYLVALDRTVSMQLDSGAGLTETISNGHLPAFANWQDFEKIHAKNIHHRYITLEHALLN